MTEPLDILDIDLAKDGDVMGSAHLRNLYDHPYSCVARKSIGLDKLYVLHMDAQWTSNQLAAALSNFSVHVSSADTLAKISTFVAHEDNIIETLYSPDNANLLFTASNGGLIRLWDMRVLGKPTQEFKDDSTGYAKPLLSFDINCEGKMLCAGTEKIKKEDSHLLFWDIRSTNWLGSYSDSHEDDISHVRFNPNESKTLATCSTDCLINIFDTSQADEDEALQYSLNAETSCGHLQWLRPKNNVQSLSVVTHTEDVQIWTVDEAAPLHSFSREQIKDALKRKKIETVYVSRCFQLAGIDEPLILAGSSTPHSGCVRLLQLSANELQPYAMLDEQGKSSQVVRCAALNPSDATLVTGGEDGVVNVWRPAADPPASAGRRVNVGKKKWKLHAKKPYAQ